MLKFLTSSGFALVMEIGSAETALSDISGDICLGNDTSFRKCCQGSAGKKQGAL